MAPDIKQRQNHFYGNCGCLPGSIALRALAAGTNSMLASARQHLASLGNGTAVTNSCTPRGRAHLSSIQRMQAPAAGSNLGGLPTSRIIGHASRR